jgi:hypothetical protein
MIKKAIGLLCCVLLLSGCKSSPQKESAPEGVRIVNIINFVRQLEPRFANESGAGQDMREVGVEELYQTVVEQVQLLKKYQLPGTFLLQYDALINPKYQQLLGNDPDYEIGAWWEITQPHVENAGMTWRGRFPWDWHANVGFATGYTPEEREKLVDVYMEKFKSIFGKYPASVGSWFIDAHTLGYLSDKYGITASCNCKDQVGTDGYTLWGGYWNQAYYPSRKNAYMPAQTEKGQIPVPVFRMLGSDPIDQYYTGGVISLEPVYTGREGGGAVKEWVDWFFDSMFNEPCLSFNYVQVGQENSFTWAQMKKGLEMQIPMIDSLRRAGKIRVETLESSGRWFKERFRVTPPTAVTTTFDYRKDGYKTLWFNSRFYRANLIWEGNSFRFRDIHIFDETVPSDYLTKPGTSTECIYKTLPLVDAFYWSNSDVAAGLRIVDESGKAFETSVPTITELSEDVIRAEFSASSGEKITITFDEKSFEVSGSKNAKWSLALIVKPDADLPFEKIGEQTIEASFIGSNYTIQCTEGHFHAGDNGGFVVHPKNGRIVINCADRK